MAATAAIFPELEADRAGNSGNHLSASFSSPIACLRPALPRGLFWPTLWIWEAAAMSPAFEGMTWQVQVCNSLPTQEMPPLRPPRAWPEAVWVCDQQKQQSRGSAASRPQSALSHSCGPRSVPRNGHVTLIPPLPKEPFL